MTMHKHVTLFPFLHQATDYGHLFYQEDELVIVNTSVGQMYKAKFVILAIPPHLIGEIRNGSRKYPPSPPMADILVCTPPSPTPLEIQI